MDKLDMMDAFDSAEQDLVLLPDIEPSFRFAKIKPTDNCNSRCVTCDYWKRKFKNELTTDEIDAVLADLHLVGVEELMITGGEPTLRSDLPEIVATASRLGFQTVGMTSNSLSLTSGKIDRLLENGLNEIALSLEGVILHDEIRGVPGNMMKVLRNLAYLQEAREKADIAVKIGTTLMSKNLGEILKIVDLARRYNATFFLNLIDRGTYFFRDASTDLFTIPDRFEFNDVIDELIDIKNAEPGLIGNTIASLEYARRYFDDPKQAHIPCHLGYVGVDIDSNGNVYSNCWGLPPVGNVRKQRLIDILRSEAYKRRCQQMFRKECPGCSCGYILNLAYHKHSVSADAEWTEWTDTALNVGYAGTKVTTAAV